MKQILTNESDNLAACYLFILERMRARHRREQEAQQYRLQTEPKGVDLQPAQNLKQEQNTATPINLTRDYSEVERVQTVA